MTSLPVSRKFLVHANLENSTGPIKHNLLKGAHLRDFFTVTAKYTCYCIECCHLLHNEQNLHTNPLRIVVLLAPGLNGIAPVGNRRHREPDRRHCRTCTSIYTPHQEDNGTHLNQNETTMERIQEKHASDVWTKIDLAP